MPYGRRIAFDLVAGRESIGSGLGVWPGTERWIHVAKLLRAHGGCLGVRRLRRAWKTAISPG